MFKELPWGPLLAHSYQNFRGTTVGRGGQFKAQTGEFGQGLVGKVVSRKFVTPGRSYKDPSRVLKTGTNYRQLRFAIDASNYRIRTPLMQYSIDAFVCHVGQY